MSEKVVEGDFTAVPEAIPEVTPEDLGKRLVADLFVFVEGKVKQHSNFPLNTLLNALNTVSLAYLVNTDSTEDQLKFLEWTYNSCIAEARRVEKLKLEKKMAEQVVTPIVEQI